MVLYLSVFVVFLIGGAIAVLFIIGKVERNTEVEELQLPRNLTEEGLSWNKCGAKTLLDVKISTQFPSKYDPCSELFNPFMILKYDAATFYDGNLQGKRPIYVDELELDPKLKKRVLEFLTGLSTMRGFDATTRFALVNGWANSTDVINNCGKQEDNIEKILATDNCFDIF